MGNYGRFTWRIKYIFGCFSACVWGISLKIHTSPFTHMCYKWSNFGGARPLFKGTLLRRHCVFLGVSWLAVERNSWKFTCHTPLMCWKWCKCDCYQSLTHRTLLGGGEYVFLVYFVFHMSDFHEISSIALSMHAYKRCKFGSDRSLIKGTLLGEQSSFRLFLIVLWRDFPENSYSLHTLTKAL